MPELGRSPSLVTALVAAWVALRSTCSRCRRFGVCSGPMGSCSPDSARRSSAPLPARRTWPLTRRPAAHAPNVRQCSENRLNKASSQVLRFSTFAGVRPGNCQKCSGRQPLDKRWHQAMSWSISAPWFLQQLSRPSSTYYSSRKRSRNSTERVTIAFVNSWPNSSLAWRASPKAPFSVISSKESGTPTLGELRTSL